MDEKGAPRSKARSRKLSPYVTPTKQVPIEVGAVKGPTRCIQFGVIAAVKVCSDAVVDPEVDADRQHEVKNVAAAVVVKAAAARLHDRRRLDGSRRRPVRFEHPLRGEGA